jgi:hypothetical protein
MIPQIFGDSACTRLLRHRLSMLGVHKKWLFIAVLWRCHDHELLHYFSSHQQNQAANNDQGHFKPIIPTVKQIDEPCRDAERGIAMETPSQEQANQVTGSNETRVTTKVTTKGAR